MSQFLVVIGSDLSKVLLATGQLAGGGAQLNASASQLNAVTQTPDWIGVSKSAQGERLAVLLQGLQQIITTIVQTQATANAGAAQMQAAKVATVSTANAATSAGFRVLPTGTVTLSPAQISYAHSHPGAGAVFRKIAALLSAQINASVASSTSADAQVAAALAQVALEYLGGLLDEKLGGASPSAATLPTLPSATPTTPTPGTAVVPPPVAGPLPGGVAVPPTTGADLSDGALGPDDTVGSDPTVGTGLAGVGTGGGSLGGAGVGAGGSLALGGAGAATTAAAVMGGTAGGPIGVGGAVSPGTAAAAGRGAPGAGPMMTPLGGHGAAGSEAGETESGTWLREDGDPWGSDDAPDGVLA